MATTKRGRDAKTGQFVPLKVTKQRPATTVVETVRAPKQPQKKR